MTKTNTSMMIAKTDLNFFGDSAKPVAIFDAATFSVLGQSTGNVSRNVLTFGGLTFDLVPAGPESNWLLLNARVEP